MKTSRLIRLFICAYLIFFIGNLGYAQIGIKWQKHFYYRDWETDRKSTRLNSSHSGESRMPSSA